MPPRNTSVLFVLSYVIKVRKSYIDNVRESRIEGMFLNGIRQILLEGKKAPLNINQKQLLWFMFWFLWWGTDIKFLMFLKSWTVCKTFLSNAPYWNGPVIIIKVQNLWTVNGSGTVKGRCFRTTPRHSNNTVITYYECQCCVLLYHYHSTIFRLMGTLWKLCIVVTPATP